MNTFKKKVIAAGSAIVALPSLSMAADPTTMALLQTEFEGKMGTTTSLIIAAFVLAMSVTIARNTHFWVRRGTRGKA